MKKILILLTGILLFFCSQKSKANSETMKSKTALNSKITENEARGGFNFYGVELQLYNNDSTKILKIDGKLRKAGSPLSEVMTVIPSGRQVKVLSYSGSYYKVNYNGKIGYVNEVYFSSFASKLTTKKAYKPNDSKPTNCDEIKYIAGTPKPTFRNMLAGVKYAVIIGKPEIIKIFVPVFNALFEYLEGMGFHIKYQNLSNNRMQSKHMCNEVRVSLIFDYDLRKFSNIKLNFISPCNSYIWHLNSCKTVKRRFV